VGSLGLFPRKVTEATKEKVFLRREEVRKKRGWRGKGNRGVEEARALFP